MTNSKGPQQPPVPAYQPNKPVAKDSGFLTTTDKKEINWFHTGLLTITPLLSVIGLFTVTPHIYTVVVAVLWYIWTGMGITGGYHRLFSHKAYKASYPVRLWLILGGAAAYEGSAKWWCRNHRAHHRYTDTDKDPYNAKEGFFYAHLGWMLVKQSSRKVGWADITDLQKDKMVEWQHKHYLPIAVTFGVLIPTLLCSLWGDAAGGFYYACMMRMVFVHHATFFVNSLAHHFGDKTFSDHHTAFDSFVTAILTLGEGYHNYHHEFPQDYRNGIRFFHYDPTKWMISFLNLFGLTYDLQYMSDEEIKKSTVQMAQRRLDQEKAQVMYGKDVNSLPLMTRNEFNKRIKDGEVLVIVDNMVHDVKGFVHEHPGGRQTLLNYTGKDVTSIFYGREGSPVHSHSKDALKYLKLMRIAKLQ